MTALTVRLAESFGSKPVRPSLLALVDQLVDANLEGSGQPEGSDAEIVYALRAAEIYAEIQKRIDELGGPA